MMINAHALLGKEGLAALTGEKRALTLFTAPHRREGGSPWGAASATQSESFPTPRARSEPSRV